MTNKFNLVKQIHKIVGFKDLEIRLVSEKYMQIKELMICVQFVVSFLAYVVIAQGYYLAGYRQLMNMTLVSLIILVFLFGCKWNKRLSSNLSSLLFIYIPIVNILVKDVFFLLQGNPLISTIFLHTHFMLLLFISFGGLVSNHRNIIFVGAISVVWVWIFTVCLDDSFLWSLIVLDTVFFVGITLIIYFAYCCVHLFNSKLSEQAELVVSQNEELNNLISLKDWMLNVIVHDIKNPINRILSASKMDVIQKEEIVEPSKYMLSIVENILDVYKMEESNMSLKLSLQRIDVVINKAYDQVRYLLDGKMITLVKQISMVPVLEIDEDLLVRVFINILSNAVKYSNSNNFIELVVYQIDGLVRVEIIDKGVGIPPEDVSRIFDKHYQSSARNLGYTRSEGIGLTFCKLAIEAHGGSIGAESELDEGTLIWFELPVVSVSGLICEEKDNNCFKSMVELSCAEKEVLLECKLKLASVAVYQTSEILNVFKYCCLNDSPELFRWQDEVVKCSMMGDAELFDELRKLSEDSNDHQADPPLSSNCEAQRFDK